MASRQKALFSHARESTTRLRVHGSSHPKTTVRRGPKRAMPFLAANPPKAKEPLGTKRQRAGSGTKISGILRSASVTCRQINPRRRRSHRPRCSAVRKRLRAAAAGRASIIWIHDSTTEYYRVSTEYSVTVPTFGGTRRRGVDDKGQTLGEQ